MLVLGPLAFAQTTLTTIITRQNCLFNFVSKNAADSVRQQQLEEIQSIRDYLARPHTKRDEKDKTYINIPVMKTFERAILMP